MEILESLGIALWAMGIWLIVIFGSCLVSWHFCYEVFHVRKPIQTTAWVSIVCIWLVGLMVCAVV